MKKNGGTLCIKFRENGKIIVILGLFLTTIQCYCQNSALIYNRKDSCFCENYFKTNNERFVGSEHYFRTVFVEGYNEPLIDVVKRINKIVDSNVLKDSINYYLVIGVLVNTDGYVKCLKVLKGENDNIVEDILKIIQNEKFKLVDTTTGKEATYPEYFTMPIIKKE